MDISEINENDKEFLIWLAGFWEGEGSFGIGKTGRYFNIAQSKKRGKKILNEIKTFLIKFDIASEVYKNIQKNNNNCYMYRTGNTEDIKKIFDLILPYLKFRKIEVIEKLDKIKNIKPQRRWNEKEIKYLIDNYNFIPKKEIVKNLERHTQWSIWSKASQLKISNRKFWNDEEIEFLKNNIDTPINEIVKSLGRSRCAVLNKRTKTGFAHKNLQEALR